MRISIFVAATCGISTITAFPFFESVGSLLERSDRRQHDVSSAYQESPGFSSDAYYFDSLLRREAPPTQNVVADAFQQIANGGDISAQILRVAQDPNLAKDALAFIKEPDSKTKLTSALSDKTLLGKLYALIGDDHLIESVASAAADGHITEALVVLSKDMDAWQTVAAIVKDPKILKALQDLLGPDWDLGGLLASQFGRPSVTHLMTNLITPLRNGAAWAKGMTALAADAQVQATLHTMMDTHTNFATVLGKTLVDQGFMMHVGQLMGFNSRAMDGVKKLCSSDNVAELYMEMVFGTQTPGMVTADMIGRGNMQTVIMNNLPSGSFNRMVLDSLADGSALQQLGDMMEHPATFKATMAMTHPTTASLVRFMARQVLRSELLVAVIFKRAIGLIIGLLAVSGGLAGLYSGSLF